MKDRATLVKLTCALGLGFFFCLDGVALAQKNSWKAKVSAAINKTPQVSARYSNQKRIDSLDWLEIEVSFTPAARTKELYVDGVQVDFFVLVDHPKGPVMLTHSLTHENVKLNKVTYSAAYISPATWSRLAGKAKAALADIKGYAVEISYGGTMVGWAAKGMKAGSWRSATNTAGGKMRSPHKTPFGIVYADRFPEISGAN